MAKAKVNPKPKPMEPTAPSSDTVIVTEADGSIRTVSIRPTIAELERFAAWVPGNVPTFKGFKAIRATIVPVSQGKQAKCYGHFQADKWSTREGELSGEIAIYSEGLRRPPVEILGTLLHELIHAKNRALNIDDCSKNGRHNKLFQKSAEAAGLICAKPVDFYGYGYTSLTETARKLIEEKFVPDAVAFSLYRLADPQKEKVATSHAYQCKCVNENGNPAFSVRVSLKVSFHAQCLDCGADFVEKRKATESEATA